MKTKKIFALILGSCLAIFLKANAVDARSAFFYPENYLTDSIAPVSSALFASGTDDISYANGIKLNPRAAGFVKDYIAKHSDQMQKLESWGRPYFNTIDVILRKNNLPVELKYLAVIESKLKSNAVSWAGAVGPWQFMPATARGYGLKVSRSVDERRDIVKSTHAAAKYITYLYKEFNDWLLVIAAYNGGPGVVYNAIKRSGSTNFWKLQNFLPAESRNHVKKFIATHYIFEGQGGITTLTRTEADEQIREVSNYLASRNLSAEELESSKNRLISGKYLAEVIARYTLMEMEEFDRYNPNFDKLMSSDENSYDLKLPAEKMQLFDAKKYQILNESVKIMLSAETTAQEKAIQHAGPLAKSGR